MSNTPNSSQDWWGQAQAAEATYWQDANPADNHTASHAGGFSATAAADAAAANVAAAQAEAAWAEGYAAGAAAAYQNQQTYQDQQAYQQQGYQPYYPTSPQQPYRQASYAPTRDHVVAGLLAIFLGSLGIHKFYLGYTSTGFIMLAVTIIGSIFTLGLAAGVMSLIGFIEGIIYLSKSQSTFDQLYVYQKKEWF